jgi:hypothetical protein
MRTISPLTLNCDISPGCTERDLEALKMKVRGSGVKAHVQWSWLRNRAAGQAWEEKAGRASLWLGIMDGLQESQSWLSDSGLSPPLLPCCDSLEPHPQAWGWQAKQRWLEQRMKVTPRSCLWPHTERFEKALAYLQPLSQDRGLSWLSQPKWQSERDSLKTKFFENSGMPL